MPPKVRLIPLADLKLDDGNVNKGTARGRQLLEQSLRQNGAARSVVVDKNNRVIAGNKTVEVARAAGMTQIAVIDVAGDTLVAVQRTDLDLRKDKKAKRLAVADNRVAEVDLAWDVTALEQLDVDLADFWNKQELAQLVGEELDEPEAVADEALALAGKWHTARGQLWTAGPHRLFCGDATDPADVAALFGDEGAAHLINTDPPYGVSYESAATGSIANDDKRDDALAQLLERSLALAVRMSAPTAAFYIWHASVTRRDFEHALDRAGLVEKQYITWVKDAFVLGHADYHWQTEPCFYAEKAGQSAPFFGSRDQSTAWTIAWRTGAGDRAISLAGGLRVSNGEGVELFVTPKAPKGKKVRLLRLRAGEPLHMAAETNAGDVWSVSHDRGTNLHPTQKPVALAARAIANSTQPGQIVYDPFLGSGFTPLAAELLGRRGFGLEIDPKFLAVVLERLSKAGLKPMLVPSEHGKGAGNGKPSRKSAKPHGAPLEAGTKRQPGRPQACPQ